MQCKAAVAPDLAAVPCSGSPKTRRQSGCWLLILISCVPGLQPDVSLALSPHVAPAAGGALIGGYHPFGWSGQGGDSDSEDAFLFFLDDDTDQMVKLEKVGGGLWH